MASMSSTKKMKRRILLHRREVEAPGLHNLFDVCDPLLRDVVWLPQASGKYHCFTNGSRAFVYLRPFSVGSSTSEFIAEWSSVDKDVARSDTDMLPLGGDIEASGLVGTRSAHEGRKCTGLNMTVNPMDKPTGSARDGDSIIDAFPGESLAVSKGSEPSP